MPMAKAKSCMSWLTRQRTCRGPLADPLNEARQVVLVAFSPAVMAHADAENVRKHETDAMSFTLSLSGSFMRQLSTRSRCDSGFHSIWQLFLVLWLAFRRRHTGQSFPPWLPILARRRNKSAT